MPLWTPADHRLDNLAMTDIAPYQDERPGKLDRISLKLMYKPIGMIGGVVGGLLASMAFARIWQAIAGKGKAPEATDKSQSWADILPAAALHGIVFGVVKAVVDRLNAKEFERKTGFWPGKQSRPAPDAQA